MRKITLSALLAAAISLPALPVHAAIGKKDEAVSPEQASNPKPEAHDILLPMPCGLHMALRAVAVPGELLQDRRFTMGLGDTEEERRLYERRFEAHIAAPFTPADLPADWTSRLDEGAANGYSFYFLGKYEVSQYQWDAVMNATCPAEPPPGGDLPKREISWFDAQDFLRKYNAWLVDERPDSLPRFAGTKNIGFLRLPTEEEWEFAARGGIRVREEDRENDDFFPLAGGKPADFGVFSDQAQTPVHEPSAIGSRKPNPLGLHDTAGNVKEMVDGFFRFSVSDMRGENEVFHRLHGASGGILCKGGSFRGNEREVLPGRRDEVPLYTADGESRPTDLGFRVALSGLNVPSGKRLDDLRRQENAGGPAPAATPPEPPTANQAEGFKINPKADPVSELKRLAGVAPVELRDDLDQLHVMLADRQSAQERQRVEALENSARSLLYQAETIRSFAVRYFGLHGQREGIIVTNKKGELVMKKLTSAQKKRVERELDEFYQVILTAANQYKRTLAQVSGGAQVELDHIMSLFRRQYSGKDSLDSHMRGNIDILEKHLKTARAQGLDKLEQKQICRDIIPEEHLKALPL